MGSQGTQEANQSSILLSARKCSPKPKSFAPAQSAGMEPLNSPAPPKPWKDAGLQPQSPGACPAITRHNKEQQTMLEPKRGEVSHQTFPPDHEPRAPLWILLIRKEFQKQTHTYKEPPALWRSALAADSSAPQLPAVWSPG